MRKSYVNKIPSVLRTSKPIFHHTWIHETLIEEPKEFLCFAQERFPDRDELEKVLLKRCKKERMGLLYYFGDVAKEICTKMEAIFKKKGVFIQFVTYDQMSFIHKCKLYWAFFVEPIEELD